MKSSSPVLRTNSLARRQRGTVMLLVVGVLTLLAVIGTTYIVMARTERTSSRASAESQNTDLARDSVMYQALSKFYESTLGGDGNLLTLPAPWQPGQTYNAGDIVMARNGLTYICFQQHTSQFDTSAGLGAPPNLPIPTRWYPLMAWSEGMDYKPNDCVVGGDSKVYQYIGAPPPNNPSVSADMAADGSLSSAKWQAAPGLNLLTKANYASLTPLPLPRYYDYPELRGVFPSYANPPGAAPGPMKKVSGRARHDWATQDQLWLVRDAFYDVTYSPGDYTVLDRQRYNSASPSSPKLAPDPTANPQGAPEVKVVDPTSTYPADGIWYVLPYTSVAGVRYRYALRIVDTGRYANLNTGSVDATLADSKGQVLTSVLLGDNSTVPPIFNSGDVAANLHNGTGATLGRRGTSGLNFALAQWHNRILAMERFGLNPASGTPPDMQPFDFSDELELRAMGTRGTGIPCRPYAIWSKTLASGAMIPAVPPSSSNPPPSLPTGPNRRFYTTFSADRHISPITMNAGQALNKPRFTVASNSATYSWPGSALPAPNRRQVNLSTPTSSDDDIIRNVAYLLNVMAAAGFPDDEALSFAINYVGQCANNRQHSVIIGNGTDWTLVITTTSGATDAVTTTAKITPASPPSGDLGQRTYMAYSAQPFLNEVAYAVTLDPITGNKTTELAVELVQPYAQNVDITGWQLRFKGQTAAWADLTSLNSGALPYTDPAAGTAQFGVVCDVASPQKLTIASGALTATAATGDVDPRGQILFLERPYLDASGAKRYMAVDQFTVPANTIWVDPTSTDSPPAKLFAAQRNNYLPDGATKDPFAADSPVNVDNTQASSLGDWNNAPASTPIIEDSVRVGLPLPDRINDGSVSSSAPTPICEINLADLHRYMRITNQAIPDAGQNYTSTAYPISDRMADVTLLPPSGAGTPWIAPQEGKIRLDFLADARAQRILQLVATVDRASDGADQYGSGQADSLEELRIHGRINVNTASPQVLRSLFYAMSADIAPSVADQIVANIVAYRDRAKTNDPAYNIKYTFNTVAPNANFSDFHTYPGYGIRSLWELMIPINAAVFSSPTNLTTRDAYWTRFFNLCTVRSDTFVVYGYMEAVQDTATTPVDLYSTTPLPASSIVAKRRFVAIVDRANANDVRGAANAQLPRIMAIRDLPQ